MAVRFKNFYIDHVPRQQNAHADALASLAASLALPAGIVEKILVYSHDLYCPRVIFEDHQKPTGDCQAKEALETSAGPEPRDWQFPYIDCNAPITRVRRRYCDVYTQVRNTLTYIR